MGIVDFLRPKYRHSNVAVRAEAVRALTPDHASILVQVARTDRDIGVRRIAIEKIDEADVLAEIAAAETERSLREVAGERAAQLWLHSACGEDADSAGGALAGIIKLGDQRALVEVVARGRNAALRKRAFGELRDPKALAELAKRDAPHDLRMAAVERIDDGDVLRALAIDTTQKEVGLAAVDKLDDADRLDNVAQKAKNKAVRQRARKIVQEIEEAEAAKKPGQSDEAKRRRAERAQLVREVEAVADSFEFDRVAAIIRAAEEAWAKLGGDEPDERFGKAVERFWKRKQVHDEQARTSQELRVVEREAREEKERAAVERVPEPKPQETDPEREAEAAARREEKARQRADEEARRAAEQAEREARRKEDADRGVAIAASLAALCLDMEQLAESRDARAIDRLLQQASKAFEQVGKVPGDQRDALSDRYTAARGKLVVRSKDLREAEDWERFANVPKAEALIQTAKQMLDAEATPDLGNRLRQLQALWKEVGPMPQRRSKELWEQFKATCDQVYDKVKGFRSVEAEKFVEVAKAKEALITEAEVLAESTDWAATADKLKALQARWKESGHLPRKQGDELWKRFRSACDRFFERRKPQLDARHAEEAENLGNKQQLIARAQAVADAAPGEGGWGRAIAEIKELQRQWKDIGYVPRRDADAVYRAFRAACDALFAKRDQSRDVEANAHRAELDEVKAEIAAVLAGEGDVVARAIEVRRKVAELDGRELAGQVVDMVRSVIASHADGVRGTELDPAALRARRDKLIAKAEELLPKQAQPVATNPADLAAQLKAAMRSNAFGDLRFSGRDPVEVIDELRAQWAEVGPILDDHDRMQADRFADACRVVLDAVRGPAPHDDDRRDDTRDRGGRRRRRRSAEQPVTSEPTPAAASATVAVVSASAAPAEPALFATASGPIAAPVPVSSTDAPTAPARLPFEPLPPPPMPEAEPTRRKSMSEMPAMDDLDTGWDLGESDPTATAEPAPPSSSEMAGDGASGGDGIDEPGWD